MCVNIYVCVFCALETQSLFRSRSECRLRRRFRCRVHQKVRGQGCLCLSRSTVDTYVAPWNVLPLGLKCVSTRGVRDGTETLLQSLDTSCCKNLTDPESGRLYTIEVPLSKGFGEFRYPDETRTKESTFHPTYENTGTRPPSLSGIVGRRSYTIVGAPDREGCPVGRVDLVPEVPESSSSLVTAPRRRSAIVCLSPLPRGHGRPPRRDPVGGVVTDGKRNRRS